MKSSILGAAMFAAAAASAASAASVIYFGESTNGVIVGAPAQARAAFLTALPYSATNDLEAFVADDEPNTLTFGTGLYAVDAIVTSDNAVVRDEPTVGRFATSGVDYLRTEEGFRLDFDTQLIAFGLYLNDATSDVTVTLLRSSGATDILARPFIDNATGGVFFFGLIDRDNPFDGIILSTSRPGNPDVFDLVGIDDLTVTPVPEPDTWVQMIGGFGAVGGAMRSARRRASATA